MMERDWLEKVLEFIPAGMRGRAVVAGGYAADPTRANDIDLWVLTNSKFAAPLILQHLRAMPGVVITELRNAEDEYQGRLVATVKDGYDGRPVQILVAPQRTARELVEWFDISTHAVAKWIDPAKPDVLQVTYAKQWTGTRVPARVLRWDTPEQTLNRLLKVTERYRIALNKNDVLRLQALIAESTVIIHPELGKAA